MIDQALTEGPMPERAQGGESGPLAQSPPTAAEAKSAVAEAPESEPSESSAEADAAASDADEPGASQSLNLRVSFTADSAELLPEARRALDRFVDELSGGGGFELTVVGHAARVGSAASSQTLSEERARVTAAYIVRRLEEEPESVFVRGAGAREPVADNETEAGRSRNRRAEVRVAFE